MSNKTRHPLSTIQEYRGIVHMMPYGSLNGPAGHMWMLFYRCGTYFELDITMSNIEDTPFAAKLAPYMVEPTTVEDQVKYLHTLTEKKALIINHIFPTLDKLAPHHAREWTTLEDILITPKYRLSLHKPETGDGDAVARVDNGPIAEPAMDVLQALFDAPSLKIDPDLLATLPQIPASSITFPEPIDSNTIPTEVIIPTSKAVIPFLPAGRTIQNMDADRITNPSHFAIKTYIELHRHLSSQPASLKDKICVQDLLAIVTTETPPPDTARDKYDATGSDQSAECPAAWPSDAATYPYKNAQMQNAIYLTGILLKPLPAGTRPLGDLSIMSLVVANPQLRRKWYSALLSTVHFVHSCAPPLYHGCIRPSAILVCPPNPDGEEDNGADTGNEEKEMLGQLYLTDFTDNSTSLRFTPHSDAWTPQGDLVALENIFGDEGWLLAEMKKTKGEVETDYEWKREGFEADQLTVQELKEAKRELEREERQKST